MIDANLTPDFLMRIAILSMAVKMGEQEFFGWLHFVWVFWGGFVCMFLGWLVWVFYPLDSS